MTNNAPLVVDKLPTTEFSIRNDAFGPTKTLIGNLIDGLRTFDSFSAGTTLVGFDTFFINPDDSTFDITVVGGSGTLSLVGQTGTSLGTFLGFQDSLGIDSISFVSTAGSSSGRGNYSFDNFQTVSSSPVPEPSSIALLITGGLCLIGYRRRRKQAALDQAELNQEQGEPRCVSIRVLEDCRRRVHHETGRLTPAARH